MAGALDADFTKPFGSSTRRRKVRKRDFKIPAPINARKRGNFISKTP
jgi:hypothetical protein